MGVDFGLGTLSCMRSILNPVQIPLVNIYNGWSEFGIMIFMTESKYFRALQVGGVWIP